MFLDVLLPPRWFTWQHITLMNVSPCSVHTHHTNSMEMPVFLILRLYSQGSDYWQEIVMPKNQAELKWGSPDKATLLVILHRLGQTGFTCPSRSLSSPILWLLDQFNVKDFSFSVSLSLLVQLPLFGILGSSSQISFSFQHSDRRCLNVSSSSTACPCLWRRRPLKSVITSRLVLWVERNGTPNIGQ